MGNTTFTQIPYAPNKMETPIFVMVLKTMYSLYKTEGRVCYNKSM
jgi:hypothetical protein